MIQIYHNPRCTKSRECLAFIENSGQEFDVIKYLETPPTFEELKDLIQKLAIEPIQLVRQKEKIWIAEFKGKSMTNDAIIHAMITHPILIERPIVINGDKAIIARPLENINNLL